MQTKTKVVIASAALGAALLTGGGIAYARDSVNIRQDLMDKIYETLPAASQVEYATQMVNDQNTETKATIVKSLVDENIFSEKDKAYIGSNSILQMASDGRSAVLEIILDKSDYNVQREVTFYGIPKLQPEDALNAGVSSVKNLWNYLSQQVQQEYQKLFKP